MRVKPSATAAEIKKAYYKAPTWPWQPRPSSFDLPKPPDPSFTISVASNATVCSQTASACLAHPSMQQEARACHPDKNPGDAEASAVIDRSNDVSDGLIRVVLKLGRRLGPRALIQVEVQMFPRTFVRERFRSVLHVLDSCFYGFCGCAVQANTKFQKLADAYQVRSSEQKCVRRETTSPLLLQVLSDPDSRTLLAAVKCHAL